MIAVQSQARERLRPIQKSCRESGGPAEFERRRTCVLGEMAMMMAVPGFGAGAPGIQLLLPVLMIGVVYLMMIRPQQKKQKQWTQMLSELKTGDRITTTGGIRGTILSLKDDALVIRVAPDGIKIEVVKSAIASVTTQEEGK
jgi:preprotein translocase subunit YajC